MIFLPKCRAFYVVLEKGHVAGEKGMALEKKGMARRHAKTGLGKHYRIRIQIRSKWNSGKNVSSI